MRACIPAGIASGARVSDESRVKVAAAASDIFFRRVAAFLRFVLSMSSLTAEI